MWHDHITGIIGKTPLVALNRIGSDLPCTLLAKVEYLNPGGSVKDRIGLAMIEAAEREGKLRPGGTIVEGTSGNTGAGLALAAIARGYRCVFTTTDKQSQEKIDVLRALGAEVIVCPTAVAPDDPRSYYSVARRLSEETANAVYLNQYDNAANEEAHYLTTGPEIWEGTEGKVTHLVSGAGTGGTISGTSRYLKEKNPDIQVVGVDPFGSVYYKYFYTREFDNAEIYPYVTEGVGEDILAGNMNFDLIDAYERVTDKDAMQTTRRLAREEGMFAGQSSGMAVAGALLYLHKHRASLTADSVAVIVLPDSGFRYLSKTYNDNWMLDHGFLERRPELTVKEVLRTRKKERDVVSVSPGDTLQEAIRRMSENAISQLPVLDGEEIVGSLTEGRILNRLIESPGAREEPVGTVMGAPLPVVEWTATIEDLSNLLEQGPGAVMVNRADGGPYEIVTKSDLIGALAAPGRRSPSREG